MVLHSPGNLLPGLEGVHEALIETAEFGASDTSKTVTFTTEGSYNDFDTSPDGPAIALGLEKTADSGGANSTATAEVVSRTAAGVFEVTVSLDAAPGGSDAVTYDVMAHILGSGPPKDV